MNIDERPYLVVTSLLAVALAVAWVWFSATLLRDEAQQALIRAGWVGVPGTVVVGECRTAAPTVDIPTTQTDCAASFTPAGGDGHARPVVLTDAGESLASASTVRAVAVGDVAYRPSGWLSLRSAVGALFIAVIGGAPFMAPAILLYTKMPRRNREISGGLATVLLCLVAIVCESTIAYLLGR